MHDEREGTCVVEEARCVCARVLDQQVEEHDRLCGFISERASGGCRDEVRAGAGAGWVGFGAAAETDYRGVFGERGEVEYAERDEARVIVVFVDDDSHDLEVVLEEIGNDDCILREETEVGVGTPFGGAQLE